MLKKKITNIKDPRKPQLLGMDAYTFATASRCVLNEAWCLKPNEVGYVVFCTNFKNLKRHKEILKRHNLMRQQIFSVYIIVTIFGTECSFRGRKNTNKWFS